MTAPEAAGEKFAGEVGSHVLKPGLASPLATIFFALALGSCSDNDDSYGPIEEYGRTLSPDGEVSAHVYHYDSPNGGLTQVVLDFVGLSVGCGAGSAAWHEFDIGVELRWIDSEILEVTYPDSKRYQHNASGDFLGCLDRGVRVVMVPRRTTPLPGGTYSEPVEFDHTPSPDSSITAYTVRYESPPGGIAQVVVNFLDTPGCADSAVTFYDHDIDLRLDWIDASTIEVRYPDGRRFDLPPWGTTVQCVTQAVQVKMQPVPELPRRLPD